MGFVTFFPAASGEGDDGGVGGGAVCASEAGRGEGGGGCFSRCHDAVCICEGVCCRREADVMPIALREIPSKAKENKSDEWSLCHENSG